jgi:hypothetical protein
MCVIRSRLCLTNDSGRDAGTEDSRLFCSVLVTAMTARLWSRHRFLTSMAQSAATPVGVAAA